MGATATARARLETTTATTTATTGARGVRPPRDRQSRPGGRQFASSPWESLVRWR
jgi:hypothetical protein